MQEHWNQYGGDSFVFEVLLVDCNGSMDGVEAQYIRRAMATGKCYNQIVTGMPYEGIKNGDELRKEVGQKRRDKLLGRKASEETKAKMRASSSHHSPSQHTREAIRKMRTGFVVSDETKQKLRELNTGSKNPVTKLNEEQVYDIKIALLNGKTQMELAKEYGVSHGAISAIYLDRSWVHIKVDGWENRIIRH